MEFHLKASLKDDITCEQETTTLSWSPSMIQKTTVSVQSTSLCVVACRVKTAFLPPQHALISNKSPQCQFSHSTLLTLLEIKSSFYLDQISD